MNKLINLGLFFLFIIYNGKSQDIVFEKRINIKGAERTLKNLSIHKDEKSEDRCFTIISELEYYAILLDSNFKEKSSLSVRKPKIIFPNHIGETYADGVYYSYTTDDSENNMYVQVFDFVNQTTSSEQFRLYLKKHEDIVGHTIRNGSLFIYTVQQNTSLLKLYEYQKLELVNELTFELRDRDFYHFLGDNLYNCINHNLLRPFSSDNVNSFIFSDMEDYMINEDSITYIISNINTVLGINLNTLETRVNTFKFNDNKSKGIFKNFSKQTNVRSAIIDRKYFRLISEKKQTTIQIFDLDDYALLKTIELDETSVLNLPYFSDKLNNSKLNREEVFEEYLTGKKALRVYRDKTNYKLDFGRDVDRMFNLYKGYFELTIDSQTLKVKEQIDETSDFLFLRYEMQNLNYEYLETLFRNKKSNLFLVQIDKKSKWMRIFD